MGIGIGSGARGHTITVTKPPPRFPTANPIAHNRRPRRMVAKPPQKMYDKNISHFEQ
nr:MAG TPA: hypothetical protein [Caudoviricetes sp.]